MAKGIPRRTVRGPRFDGARHLDAYLRGLEMSVTDFCNLHHLDFQGVRKLLSGEVKRPSLEIVMQLHRATAGEILPEEWEAHTLRSENSESGFDTFEADFADTDPHMPDMSEFE